MPYFSRILNLVMGGGGVKGIAYIGMYDAAERKGYRISNITGVSAGALAGAFMGAGYRSSDLWGVMQSFNFQKVQMGNSPRNLPVVSRFIEYNGRYRGDGSKVVEDFLSHAAPDRLAEIEGNGIECEQQRCGFLSNIATFGKEGCLFDGDYLEEWISKILARRGIRTFADLRGGVTDKANPKGYKVRMTGVDCNRAKVVVLPDGMEFYGINPDNFEVAKAVRISTCVPFAFKPVVIKKESSGSVKSYNLVDGGVLDSFPSWLISNRYIPTVAFTLNGGEKNKFFSLDTPLNILKTLISSVHDIGVPKYSMNDVKFIGEINTTKVSFLDFNLSDEDKEYLFNAGRQTAVLLINKYEKTVLGYRRNVFPYMFPIFRRRRF